MERKAPSKRKEQEVRELISGIRGSSDGPAMLSELVRLSTEKVVQELLEKEQEEVLGRGRYERVDRPFGDGQRNGYEDGTLKTAEGVLKVKLPQVRGLEKPYRSQIWDHVSNRSEALEQIIMEMWTRGLSVRDIEEAFIAATGAFVLSDTSVSEVTEKLYKQYEDFKQRDLSGIDVAYLFIDAVYEPLRRYGSKMAVLCAWGICSDGSKVLLSLTNGNTESFDTSIEFLRDMVRRGLCSPITITTDGAPGMTKAVDTLWPKSMRVRCWFHKMQNLQDKVPPSAWQEFKVKITDIRDAPTVDDARARAELLLSIYEKEFPEACRCLKDDFEASLNHLRVPPKHRQSVRTTNLVERSFVEERRRTKTIPHLWDERSAVKLVFATLIRVSERWAKKQYSAIEERMIHQLRKTLELEDRVTKIEEHESQKRRSASRVAS